MRKLLVVLLIVVCVFFIDLALGQPIPTTGAWLFRILIDTPNTYSSQGLKGLRVNTGETAIEFYAFADSIALTTDTTGNYVKSITNGTGITGGDGGSEGAALTIATTLGTSISAAEMANEDHGDFTYSGGSATLDADVVGSNEIADADYGDFTFTSGSAALDADVVGGDEILDADYGDFTFSSGSATLDADVVGGDEILDADYGDFTFSSGSATLDTDSVADNEIDYSAVTLDDFDYQGNYKTFYSDGSGDVQELAPGTNTWVLTSQGTETAPAWAEATGGAGGDAWSDAVDSDILPTGNDNTYDLGSVAASFKDGYFQGTLEAGTLTEGGQAVWNATETDILDSGHYIAGSIDYKHLADDVISGAAAVGTFESGDTFLVLEAGVGLREVDYDDLPGAAGITAWDDIGDPGADGSIAFGGYEQIITSTLDEANHVVFKIDHTDDNVSYATTIFEIQSVDDADADLTYIKIVDDSGGTPNTVFSVGANGAIATDGSITSGGVGSFTDTLGLTRVDDNQHPSFWMRKKRDGDPTSNVSEYDCLGAIEFWGYHTDGYDKGASIGVYVDNTPGEDDMPSALVFSTSADGSDSPAVRLTIDSAGNTEIGFDALAYLRIATADGGITTISQISDGTDEIKFGDGDDLISVDSGNWDVSNAGAFSGLTGITSTGAVDFNGATTAIPWKVNATAEPTVEGQAIWESDTDELTVGDGSVSVVIAAKTNAVFCFNIHDIDSGFDDIKMPFIRATTITKVTVFVTGGTNVIGRLYEVDGDGDDADAVGVESGDWTFTTGETEDTSFNNATFDAGDYIQWDTTSVSGTVTGFMISVEGYEI